MDSSKTSEFTCLVNDRGNDVSAYLSISQDQCILKLATGYEFCRFSCSHVIDVVDKATAVDIVLQNKVLVLSCLLGKEHLLQCLRNCSTSSTLHNQSSTLPSPNDSNPFLSNSVNSSLSNTPSPIDVQNVKTPPVAVADFKTPQVPVSTTALESRATVPTRSLPSTRHRAEPLDAASPQSVWNKQRHSLLSSLTQGVVTSEPVNQSATSNSNNKQVPRTTASEVAETAAVSTEITRLNEGDLLLDSSRNRTTGSSLYMAEGSTGRVKHHCSNCGRPKHVCCHHHHTHGSGTNSDSYYSTGKSVWHESSQGSTSTASTSWSDVNPLYRTPQGGPASSHSQQCSTEQSFASDGAGTFEDLQPAQGDTPILSEAIGEDFKPKNSMYAHIKMPNGTRKFLTPDMESIKMADALAIIAEGYSSRYFLHQYGCTPQNTLTAFLLMESDNYRCAACVALGAGSICITGENFQIDGTVVHDGHSMVVARRAFVSFLYDQLKLACIGAPSVFVHAGDKWRLHPKLSVCMYCTEPPCGDGSQFPMDDNRMNVSYAGQGFAPHMAAMGDTSGELGYGKLRVKKGSRRNTQVLEDMSSSTPQDVEGMLSGKAIFNMSCSDKIAMWNVTGVQGALLSHFLEPVYVSNIVFGCSIDWGHLSRALCCRISPYILDLPKPYRLTHPNIMKTCDIQHSAWDDSTANSYDICAMDWHWGGAVELVWSKYGMLYDSASQQFFNPQICKRSLFDHFLELRNYSALLHADESLTKYNYREMKQLAKEYQDAKRAAKSAFQAGDLGVWTGKPNEVDGFAVYLDK